MVRIVSSCESRFLFMQLVAGGDGVLAFSLKAAAITDESQILLTGTTGL